MRPQGFTTRRVMLGNGTFPPSEFGTLMKLWLTTFLRGRFACGQRRDLPPRPKHHRRAQR